MPGAVVRREQNVVGEPVRPLLVSVPEALPDRDLGVATAQISSGIGVALSGKSKPENGARRVLGEHILFALVVALRQRRKESHRQRVVVGAIHLRKHLVDLHEDLAEIVSLAVLVLPENQDPIALLDRALAVAETLRSEEHTSELQSLAYLVCRLLLEKKKK